MTNCAIDWKKCGGIAALLITALIWGFAFAFQRSGVAELSANQFTALRSVLGCVVLWPVIAVLDLVNGVKPGLWGNCKSKEARRTLLWGGLCCGLVLGCSSSLQQWGMVYVSAGKGGFLTALYIVIVPVLGIFLKRRTSWMLWCAVGLALTGSYLLCNLQNGFGALGIGEILLLLCSVGFSGHILVIDHFAPQTDCVRMSCIQFFITALVGIGVSAAFGETWDWTLIKRAMIPILYCGIGSSGIAFTLQIVGQKYVDPVPSSLIMSLESVFSVVGGWVILNETLTCRELFGCAIILCAVILAQIPAGKSVPQQKA